MNVLPTELDGVVILEPEVLSDARGYLVEQFGAEAYAGLGLQGVGPQGPSIALINHSHSVRGTIRGLHFQEPEPQGKLVWVTAGRIWNVAVDVRRGSPQFGCWTGSWLDGSDHRVMWLPPGFAHGYAATTEQVDVFYACTAPFRPTARHAVSWKDPEIGVDWPVVEPTLSERDARAPFLRDAPILPQYRAL